MLFEKRDSVSLTNPPEWLIESLGSSTYSNENVTVERALTVPAVLAGFSILTEDTASLPLILYRRLARGKERASDHPLYRLLHDEPNPEMTSMVFRELVIGHLLGWGNFYGQMIWDSRGVVTALYPLNPANMQVGRKDGERIYLYQTQSGQQIAFRQDQVLHIPAFGFDGVQGKSRISMARNAIGLAMAAEKYGSKIFANDARPSVALIHPGQIGTEAAKNLRESWSQIYSGASNAGKVAVLEEGIDLKTIGFPPEDAQFIQTQKWTIQQISRVFRIPPFMLGDVERTTSWGSGIEQQAIGYITNTLRPWTVRIDQQLNKDLLLDSEKGEYFFEHLFDDLLRTDVKSRMEAYAVAITNGILTRNEVREAENRQPYDGGDEPLYPLNLGAEGDHNQNDTPQDQPSDTSADQPDPKRDITPLLMDAVRRISKRDSNELSGALKRYADKDDRFPAWVEQFYKRDLPEFMQATFQPLIDAGFIESAHVQRFIVSVIDQRGQDIQSANYSTFDPLALLNFYQEASHA